MANEEPLEISFEEALEQIERIVRDMEDGKLGLDESLAKYERGIGLLKHCHGQLRNAEQKILQLSGLTEDKEAILKPFSANRPNDPSGPQKNGPRLHSND